MVIKFEAEAQSINEYLVLKYGPSSVPSEDPHTWKYYLNLAGEYHFTDTPMTVVSLDTQQEIAFTKENMKLHLTTRQAYGYGSRYYYALVSKFPSQENLIRSILLPVDIETAINAKDFKILTYPSRLVEPQEVNLIEELQGHLDRFEQRWYLGRFNKSDNYYDLVFWAYLVMTLTPKIANIRLRNVKTRYAHSFHVREALASNFSLDEYYDYLTHTQRMWLYKNYSRFEEDLGKTGQFLELTDKLLTNRGVPLSALVVRQENGFTEDLDPIINIHREAVNSVPSAFQDVTLTPDELIEKESKITYGNPRFWGNNKEKSIQAITLTSSSTTQTKDLESSMVDYSDAFPETRKEVYLREWANLSLTGKYLPYVRFIDPQTGEQRSLRADDALLYMQYASLMISGIEVDKVPNLMVWRHRLQPKATKQDLLSVTTGKYPKMMEEYADIVVSREESVGEIVSIPAFSEYVERQFENTQVYWKLQGLEEDHRVLGELKSLLARNYGCTHFVRNDETIGQWLERVNLPLWSFDTSQAQELIVGIFTAATGYNIGKQTAAQVQKAMIGTLMKLLSYSVQIITDINDSSIVPLNWSVVRINPPDISSKSEVSLAIDTDIQDVFYETKSKIDLGLDLESNGEIIGVSTESRIEVPVSVDTNVNVKLSGDIYHLNSGVSIMDAVYPGYREDISYRASYYGKELFMNLTEEQRREIMM